MRHYNWKCSDDMKNIMMHMICVMISVFYTEAAGGFVLNGFIG